MNTNLQNIFDFGDFDKRKIPMQETFNEQNLDFLLWFNDCVYDCHKEAQQKVLSLFSVNEMDNNLPAVTMISFIRKKIIAKFPDYCRRATRSRFKLITPDSQYLFIKKLDEDKKPSNIKTKENDLILNQCVTLDDNPNIFIGYTATEYISHITGVFASCIVGDKLEWVTDISLLQSNQSGNLEQFSPTKTPPVLKPGIISLKKSIKNE